MNRIWKSSFLVLVLIFVLTVITQAVTLSKVQQRYFHIQDFTAAFKQETFQVIANKTVHFDGKVSYKRGSGVRMDVAKPEKQILILKGQMVLVILPEEGTSQVQEIPNEIAAQNLLGFFTGLNSIEEQYTVQDTDDHLVLIPKNGTGSISVWVDEDNLINRILLKDAMGNMSDVMLSSYRFNKGLKDELFQQKPGSAIVNPKEKPPGN
ncbi:MAG TPA: outer membrane lipoprotein carrier protein LolA [Desulfomonilia bacterium]|nr:outer membrane lipoprotein carrier protein LolA [Desulfomonilia bacterium]